MMRRAADTRAVHEWNTTYHISLSHNAHRTNTEKELVAALNGKYNWFEGDIRVGSDGTVIMSHDRHDQGSIRTDEWIKIGAASGRGLKFDFKEARAIEPVLKMAKELGIPDERLIFNCTVLDPRGNYANASVEQLQNIRRQFPKAIINISFPLPYSAERIYAAAQIAEIVGSPIMYPLRSDQITPAVVRALAVSGIVAAWNDPAKFSPPDIAFETARLRAMGINGMIDLRQAEQ